jgi:CBS domain-containing protein
MKLGDLLNAKDSEYRVAVTVLPEETVLAAIHKLAEHDKGSLLVCDHRGKLMGIVSERDIVRKCFISVQDLDKIKIQDVMTKKVIVGNPEDDLCYAISVMKEKRIRHIPIVDEEANVIGMISMRDLLGVQLEQCNIELKFLNDYIYSGR